MYLKQEEVFWGERHASLVTRAVQGQRAPSQAWRPCAGVPLSASARALGDCCLSVLSGSVYVPGACRIQNNKYSGFEGGEVW